MGIYLNIDFSETPEKCESNGTYITRITEQLKEDLRSAYPDLSLDTGKADFKVFGRFGTECVPGI